MVTLKASLRAARDALGKAEYEAAIHHCEEAIQLDQQSYDAYLFLGKAAYKLGKYVDSDAAYQSAVLINPSALHAWKGLAELHSAGGDVDKTAEAYEKLLELSDGVEDSSKQLEYHWRLAQAYNHQGRFAEAAQQLQHILGFPEVSDADSLRALCLLAGAQCGQEQVALETAVESALSSPQQHPPVATPVRMSIHDSLITSPEGEALTNTLQQIMQRTLPSEQYIKFYDEYLHRCLVQVLAAPPRSVERENRRTHALCECLYITTAHPGGCCSALPFEAALWLWEEEEELKGGSAAIGGQSVGTIRRQVSIGGGFWLGASGLFGGGQDVVVENVKDLGIRFVHQFPSHPAAQAVWALTLRRKLLTDSKAPMAPGKRRYIAQLLSLAMSDGAPTAAGWKALAELYYQNMQYQAAYDAADKGLHWMAMRRNLGHESLLQCALPMRVVMARSLMKLGRIEEADKEFRILAGWVSEGEAAFGTLTGAPPMSVHQQALRGVAQCALAQGERAVTKSQYEAILGAALMGRGVAEHWAHAEYGWLMAEDGDLHTAEQQLLKAIDIAGDPSCHATSSELARHHYMLGRVYWNMGGKYREDKKYAAHHFMAAAQTENPHQGAAFAQLGTYFAEVLQDLPRAKKCFQKAIALDPMMDKAGGAKPAVPAMRSDSTGMQWLRDVKIPMKAWDNLLKDTSTAAARADVQS